VDTTLFMRLFCDHVRRMVLLRITGELGKSGIFRTAAAAAITLGP
jgi:hypothetical protein